MSTLEPTDPQLRGLRPNPNWVKGGPSPNPGGISKAERDFRETINAHHIPKASALLAKVYELGMDGDPKMAELFFKVCGLIKKPTDDAAIEATARKLLDGMLAEARARRAAGE